MKLHNVKRKILTVSLILASLLLFNQNKSIGASGDPVWRPNSKAALEFWMYPEWPFTIKLINCCKDATVSEMCWEGTTDPECDSWWRYVLEPE